MYIQPGDDYKIEFTYRSRYEVMQVIATQFKRLGHDIGVFTGDYPELKTYKEEPILQTIEVRSTAISYDLIEDILGHAVDRKNCRINLSCKDVYKLYMWAIKGNIQYNQKLNMKTFYSFCLDWDDPNMYGFYPKEFKETMKSFWYESAIILCKKQSDKNVQWVICLDKNDQRNRNEKIKPEIHRSITEYTEAMSKYISNTYGINTPKVKIYKKQGGSILIYNNIPKDSFHQFKTLLKLKGIDTHGRYINLLPNYAQLYG